MSELVTAYKIRFKQLVWLFIIVFFIHNIEELVTVNFWIKENLHLLPLFLKTTITTYIINDLKSFYIIAISFATLFPLVVCIWANNTSNFKITSFLMITMSWVLLINALQHIFTTLIVSKYSPGFLTALFINLPFSSYLLYRFYKEKSITKRKIILFMPIGLLVYILSIIIIFLISYNILIHI
jgi:hypothetical protein